MFQKPFNTLAAFAAMLGSVSASELPPVDMTGADWTNLGVTRNLFSVTQEKKSPLTEKEMLDVLNGTIEVLSKIPEAKDAYAYIKEKKITFKIVPENLSTFPFPLPATSTLQFSDKLLNSYFENVSKEIPTKLEALKAMSVGLVPRIVNQATLIELADERKKSGIPSDLIAAEDHSLAALKEVIVLYAMIEQSKSSNSVPLFHENSMLNMGLFSSMGYIGADQFFIKVNGSIKLFNSDSKSIVEQLNNYLPNIKACIQLKEKEDDLRIEFQIDPDNEDLKKIIEILDTLPDTKEIEKSLSVTEELIKFYSDSENASKANKVYTALKNNGETLAKGANLYNKRFNGFQSYGPSDFDDLKPLSPPKPVTVEDLKLSVSKVEAKITENDTDFLSIFFDSVFRNYNSLNSEIQKKEEGLIKEISKKSLPFLIIDSQKWLSRIGRDRIDCVEFACKMAGKDPKVELEKTYQNFLVIIKKEIDELFSEVKDIKTDDKLMISIRSNLIQYSLDDLREWISKGRIKEPAFLKDYEKRQEELKERIKKMNKDG